MAIATDFKLDVPIAYIEHYPLRHRGRKLSHEGHVVEGYGHDIKPRVTQIILWFISESCFIAHRNA